jgi:hypothetical protein
MNREWVLPIVVLGCLVGCLCLVSVACLGLAGLGLFTLPVSTEIIPGFGQEAQVVITEEAAIPPTEVAPTIDPHSLATEVPSLPEPTRIVELPTPVPTDTLRLLNDTVVPPNSWAELSARLLGIANIPQTVAAPTVPYQVGDRRQFWITNTDTSQSSQVQAVLRAVGEHVYFWVEQGVQYDEGELSRLVQVFDEKIFPTNREFFGSEWSPGVDNDPRLYILFARQVGSSLVGYFSSADEAHPLAHEHSNAAEMFILSADNIQSLDSDYTYGILAHEYQHMIHWYRDRNENSWLNEGFSELAALLNGFYLSGFDDLYLQDTDIQLTDWPDEPGTTRPHYGASFLFLTYFLDRFGEQATQAVIRHPNNGMTSVDDVLADIQARDDLTGQLIQADDLFADWSVANYLMDPTVADGRYRYQIFESSTQAAVTEEITRCPTGEMQRSVHQYGVDYILLDCPNGTYTLTFQGAQQVNVVPAAAHSGAFTFWSNMGDESDMRLTRRFDFTGVTGPLTLNYWTWYELETDYDYLYVLASEDDGQTWKFLFTPSGTPEDPSGNSYGWGYNGVSGGGSAPVWIEESVDLSQFAGKEVLIRFEYVTDTAVTSEGFLLDDVSVPQVGYFSDFEQDHGGWEAEGWVRMDNILPQTFRLALIAQGGETTVTYIPVRPDGLVQIPLTFDQQVREVVLVVTGTTRFTRQEASYEFSVSK